MKRSRNVFRRLRIRKPRANNWGKEENKMEQLEQTIGYTFHNKKLLKQAMTHSSYANE